MIKISGEISRSFTFPAPLDIAFNHYRDIQELIAYLPHIEMEHYNAATSQLRTRYSTREMGAYDIDIICDLDFEVDLSNYTLYVTAVDRLPAIRPQVSLNSTLARGYFTCESYFAPSESDRETLIDYHISIQAKLPSPKGLRFMPGRVISKIVSGITNGRMKEIADGFIVNSISAFEVTQAGKI